MNSFVVTTVDGVYIPDDYEYPEDPAEVLRETFRKLIEKDQESTRRLQETLERVSKKMVGILEELVEVVEEIEKTTSTHDSE